MVSTFTSPHADFPVSARRTTEVGVLCSDPSDFRTRRLLSIVAERLPATLRTRTYTSYVELRDELRDAGASVCLVDDAVGLREVARMVRSVRDANRRCACVVLTNSLDRELHSRYAEYGAGEILLWQDTVDPERAGLNVYRAVRSALVRALLEAEVKEMGERYDFVWRSSPAPFFRIEGRGRIMACNDAFAKLLGYESPRDLNGRPLMEVEPGEGDNVVPFRSLESRALRTCTLRKKDGDGVVVELLDKVAPGEHLELMQLARLGGPDYELPVREGFVATEGSKELELRRQLSRYETIYNSLFSAMAEGFIIADARGRISSCNAACQATLGIELREVHGQHLDDVLGFNSCDDSRTEVFSEIYDGKARVFELSRRDVDDDQPEEPVWVRCKASLIGIPGAKSVVRRSQFLISVIDITPQIEAEKRAAGAELGSRLAVGVSHDMRNYLTAIASSASLMQRMLDGQDPALLDYAVQIEEVALSSAGLLEQGVRAARPLTYEMRLVHVGSVIDGIDRLLHSLLPKRMKLEIELPPTSTLTVLALKGSLEQIIINLVLNARQALGEAGTVRVGVDCLRLNDQNHFGIAGGRAVVLSVEDDGPGISEAVQNRMFEPFFTGRDDGSGLGLSMVRELVLQLRGGIVCESQEGKGAKFLVAFPFADRGPVSGPTPQIATPPV